MSFPARLLGSRPRFGQKGAWFGNERLNPEAGSEAKARSDEKQSEAKARVRSEVRPEPKELL